MNCNPRCTVVLALSVLFLFGSPVIAQDTDGNGGAWEGYQLETVSSNVSESMAPSVCVDALGQVHMAWEDHRFDYGTEVCYARRNATGAKVVDDLPLGERFIETLEPPVSEYRAFSPNVLIDGEGNASVVFLEEHWRDDRGSTTYIFAIRQAGIGPDGFYRRANSVMTRRVETSFFRTSARVVDGLAVAPGGDGGYHLMYVYAPDILDYDQKQVFYVGLDEYFEVDIGPVALTNYTDSMIWGPDITVADGNVHAVWARSPVHTTSGGGKAWNTTEYDYIVVDGDDGSVVSNVTGFARREFPDGDHQVAAIDADADGRVHVVLAGEPGGNLVYARMAADGEILVPPTSFHDGWYEDVSIVVEASDFLHAVVTTGSDPLGPGSSLWYVKFNLTEGAPASSPYEARIGGPVTPPGQGSVRVAVDGSGYAYIVWDDRELEDGKLVDVAMYTTNAVLAPEEGPPGDGDGEDDDGLIMVLLLLLLIVVVLFIAWRWGGAGDVG